MSAASLGISHDQRKKDLLRELELVLKAAVGSRQASSQSLSPELTSNVCNVVEAVFIHGLRDPFFLRGSRYAKYPEPNFWPFVSKYTHRATTRQIQGLGQIKTEIGKSRAWIRIVLNDSALDQYLDLLMAEKKALSQFYHEEGLLRDSEQIEKAKGLLKGLGGLKVSAPTNSSLLNAWTPSPLILAGLVEGRPIRVGSLAPRRVGSKSEINPEELGICAMELLPGPLVVGSPTLGGPFRVPSSSSLSPLPGRLRHTSREEEDDNSSVYSHPSMVADPLNSPFVPVVRAKRKRNMSRSSSDGSRKSASGSGRKVEEKRTPPVATPEEETVDGEADRRKRKETAVDSGVESEAAGLSIVPTPVEASFFVGSPMMRENNENDEGEKGECKNEEVLNAQVDDPSLIFDISGDEVAAEEEEAKDEKKDLSLAEELGPLLSVPNEPSAVDEGVASPAGNSLLGRTWQSSRFSECEGTVVSTCSQSGSEAGRASFSSNRGPHDSSPDTDNSPIQPITFGVALRKHLDQQRSSSGSEELEEFREVFEDDEETEVEEDPEEVEKERLAAEERDALTKLTTLAREKGLHAQDFRCTMCKSTIGLETYRGYSVCSLDASYYCAECWQQGAESVVPGRILLNWDTRPKKISPRSRAFLDTVADKPLIHVDQVNPTLYDHSAAMKEARDLRTKLQLVAMYLFNCRETVAVDMKRRLGPKAYLIDDIHLYSYNDLLSVVSGAMARQLSLLLKYAIGHVYSCLLCSQKGFVCEYCHDSMTIYPFQTEITHRCGQCLTVSHSTCSAASSQCVKCERRSKYSSSHHSTHLPIDC